MADLFSEEEQATRLRQLWNEYGLVTVLGIVLAIGAVIGFQLYQDYRHDTRIAAADLYNEFETRRGVGGDVQEVLTKLESEHPDSHFRVFALLYLAKDAADEKDYRLAHDHVSAALEIAGKRPFADLLRIRKARLEVQLAEYEEALSSLATIQTGYETYKHELVGDIRLAQQAHSEALLAYESALASTEEPLATMRIESKVAMIPASVTEMPSMTQEEFDELEANQVIEIAIPETNEVEVDLTAPEDESSDAE